MPAPGPRRSRDARAILAAGVAAADPAACVRRYLGRRGATTLEIAGEPLELPGCVHVLAVGKAAASMAAAVGEVLEGVAGERLVVTVADGAGAAAPGQPICIAGHPVPDARSLEGARRAAELLLGAGGDDLVIVALSGGASALLADLADGVSLDDLQRTTALLQRAGATVQELNAVRKHLGSLKGGLAACAAYPARVLGLVLSDVVGSPLHAVASGPTVADPTTFADCLAILARHGATEAVPSAVRRRLLAGAAGRIQETPKPGDVRLGRTRTLLVGDNRVALAGAAAQARARGYRVKLLTAALVGEARDAGRRLASVARRLALRRPLRGDVCLLAGGETTVAVRGSGRGGRNLELALGAVPTLDGLHDVCLASLGSDGIDGTSDAAGACVDGSTAATATAAGLDVIAHLNDNDSHEFFRRLGTAIITGPTGTNVMDLQVLLIGAR